VLLQEKILHQDVEGEELETEWEHQRVIGGLNFLEKSTPPNIVYPVHQCTRFSNGPKASLKTTIL